jgi:hypothetical protein
VISNGVSGCASSRRRMTELTGGVAAT